ncbi:hypothetical protein [Amorphus coralli]|uniref:hypothetical protein n=1 Tax=Amorphus coralli TaxID=340680 RepID=UPI000379D3E0|nr:hypothetical protein [Amorphus coralli]
MRLNLSAIRKSTDNLTPRRAASPFATLIVGSGLALAIALALAPAAQAVIEVAVR